MHVNIFAGNVVSNYMSFTIKTWLKERYEQIVNSIAFLPALIAGIFLVISIAAIAFDFSETGKHFKSQLHWLSLKDASTARSIVSVIASGVISITIFSFSMVMIMLNQAASQMSNRILDKLIGNRFQQTVLGFYIGTIVFALFLLSTIRNIDSGVQIPALSTYLLICMAILDIFIFIYFLHYITQAVKYEKIIHKIYSETYDQLKKICLLTEAPDENRGVEWLYEIKSVNAGVYAGVDRKALLKVVDKYDLIIKCIHYPGTFLLKGLPLFMTNKTVSADAEEEILDSIYLYKGKVVKKDTFYGFRQLTEIALRALSPGINDPGTAILCIRALFMLYSYRICYYADDSIRNEKEEIRIITKELPFEKIFEETILPIWDYGRNDRMIQHEMEYLLTQFLSLHYHVIAEKLLQMVRAEKIKKEELEK